MKFKDILAVVSSESRDQATLDCAEQLVEQNAGRLSVSLIGWMPSVLPGEPFIGNPFYGELVQAAHKEIAEEVKRVKRRLPDADIAPNMLEIGVASLVIGMRARHADLSLVTRPAKEGGDLNKVILEAVLFQSGRPVLVVPPTWKRQIVGRSVLIAWKPTREAVRALAEAEDFIAGADRTTVVTVNARPSEDGYGENPGADITAHLARRGVKVELTHIDAAGRSEAKAILDQAAAVGADLVVMGGYGRSRLREFIFGGVTQEVLETATIPVLMAH